MKRTSQLLTIESYRSSVLVDMTRVFGKTIDPADIRTAVSEALEIYIRSLNKGDIKQEEAVFAYIRSVARHAILKHIRRSRLESHMADLLEEPMVCDPNFMLFEISDLLKSIMKELPTQYQTVLMLYYHDGYSIKEVAEMMGRSIAATYHLKERAEKLARNTATRFGAPPHKKRAKSNSAK